MSLQRFSVATFNLFNLQLPGLDDEPAGRRCGPRPSSTARSAGSAGSWPRWTPTSSGLQELWHADAMAQVLAASGLDATYDLLARAGQRETHRLRCAGP